MAAPWFKPDADRQLRRPRWDGRSRRRQQKDRFARPLELVERGPFSPACVTAFIVRSL